MLILAFNRPEATRRVMDALSVARPSRVFLAVDGPRPGHAQDAERVSAVHSLAQCLDWECEVRTLFRPANLGCKVAVSEAISWFFHKVEAGIILEDDCIPHPSFFPFASELLERYRNDERVLMISGDNFQFGRRRTDYSYYFSRFTHIWGWATWRRSWRLYDHGMALWPELRDGGWLLDVLGDKTAARYWRRIFDDTYHERNTSWAYRWTYAAWVNNALTILPQVNLVSNVGFGELATHTLSRKNRFAALPTVTIPFPLRHPPYMIDDRVADTFTQRTMFATPPLWRRVARKIYRILMKR